MLKDAPIHPTVATKDLAKARAWYADKVGWEPVLEPTGVLVYQVGQSFFTIFESDFPGTAKNTVMNWIVRDVRSDAARLRERGVTFEEYDMGDFKTVDGIAEGPGDNVNAWFKDADGNIIGVLQDASVPESGVVTAMLAASDLDRAKAWYADKLGLEPVHEFEDVLFTCESGNSQFSVYKTDFAGTAKNTVAIWRVKDVASDVAQLRDRGVVFEEYDMGEDGKTINGIMRNPDGEVVAWFKDSEGNVLALTEDRGDFPA
jgi:catechol 2,3-dioxygenase-like lactoylglutathione lyase family enzyme